MIGKELKKLNRRELVDVIYQLKKNEEQMQQEIEKLKAELQDRRIHISVAGSIAEAATDITNLFSSAQTTADLYLHEIACMKEEAEIECQKMIEEAKKEVDFLSARYENDYKRWQQLCTQIQRLEEQKNEN